MKRRQSIIALFAITTIFIVSCSTTKSSNYATKDVDSMIKKINKYMNLASKCSKDSELNEKEIKKLNDLNAELTGFEEEMDEKYRNDSIGNKIVEEYMKKNDAEYEKLFDEFYNIMLKLYECEGSDKVD